MSYGLSGVESFEAARMLFTFSGVGVIAVYLMRGLKPGRQILISFAVVVLGMTVMIVLGLVRNFGVWNSITNFSSYCKLPV